MTPHLFRRQQRDELRLNARVALRIRLRDPDELGRWIRPRQSAWVLSRTTSVKPDVLGSYPRPALPGQLTPTGWKAAAAFYKRQGREPSFVALEGYDTIAVLAHALERTPDLSAESICGALRAVAAPGTRGVVSFAAEPEGAVHHQWAWPPICVAARGNPGRPLSEADVLWPLE